MPYANISDLPAQFGKLPDGAKEIAMNVINSALERGASEESAFKQSWGAIKKSYKQDDEGNWVKMEELETVDLDSVEILGVGTWVGTGGTKTYKKNDLDDIVKAFNILTGDAKLNYEPPVKLGHDDHQKILQKDGYPAAGWVRSLKRVGDKLVASLGDVPKKIGDIIKAGGYKKVSSEIYHDYEQGKHKFPLALRAVALLGGDIPAVKTIADIKAQYSEEDGYDTVIYEFGEATINLEDLYSGLDAWLTQAESLIKGKIGSPVIRTFVAEVKARLKGLLSKQSKHAEDTSLDQQLNRIHDAFYKQFRRSDRPIAMDDSGYIRETHEGYVIMEKDAELFKLPYSDKEGEITFDEDKAVKVRRVYEVIKEELEETIILEGAWTDELKEWDTKYINELPDSAFAFVRSGGEKNGEGKTKPRALRFLPYKNAQGGIDLPHLRAALSRLTQTSLSPEEQAKARRVLVAEAKKAGVGEHIESTLREEAMLEELRKLYGLAEDAPESEVIAAATKSKQDAEAKGQTVSLAEHEVTKGQVTTLQERIDLKERDDRISKAIQAGKLAPAQKESAEKWAMEDPQGFDSFIEAQPAVVKLDEVGGDLQPGDIGELSENEQKVANEVGNTAEELLEDKKEQLASQGVS
jgi:cation transport regulator ChaB/phage I-like protein